MSFEAFDTGDDHSSTNGSHSRFGLRFDFPQVNIPYIKVPNLSQTQNLVSRLMSRTDTSRSSANLCENCGEKFNLLVRRKKTCAECAMDFCVDCFAKDLRRGSHESLRTRCRRCRVFNSVPLDRTALLSLRVRDLRWYLDKKGISAQFCNEKSELVDLILQSNNRASQRTRSVETPFSHPSSSRATEECDNDSNWVFVNDEDIRDVSADARRERQRDVPHSAEFDEKSANEDLKLFNINDLKSEEDIQNLSVRQLKLLLTRNFVNYRGCCEKEELEQKVLRLWRDNQHQLKDADDIEENNLCKICMEREINCVLLECGHMIACSECGKRLSDCPICRQFVVRVIRTFKS